MLIKFHYKILDKNRYDNLASLVKLINKSLINANKRRKAIELFLDVSAKDNAWLVRELFKKYNNSALVLKRPTFENNSIILKNDRTYNEGYINNVYSYYGVVNVFDRGLQEEINYSNKKYDFIIFEERYDFFNEDIEYLEEIKPKIKFFLFMGKRRHNKKKVFTQKLIFNTNKD